MCQRNAMTAEKVLLDGKRFLVTGGSSGIGAEVARTLALWGAHVMIACRSEEKGKAVLKRILAHRPDATVTILSDADTSDLDSMQILSEKIVSMDDGRGLDGLILNAGIAGRPYERSRQGYELHVATNVLGHHLLVRKLLLKIARSDKLKVVYVTGDIYVLAGDCKLN